MDEEEQNPGPNTILGRLSKLERKRGQSKASRAHEKALADAMRKSSRRTDDPALEDFREDLFSELRKMIKPAIAQAKKGKPALLRILTRYSR